MNDGAIRDSTSLPVRGYLLHITHYDPQWIKGKDTEEPFDLELGLEVVDALAEAGLNLLMIDPKDGVRYETHPELSRHYSQDIGILHELATRARQHDMDVSIKLNFSQSGHHQHNHWFLPHADLFDSDEYWARAFEVIDEITDVVKPLRYFHVGMDEDHDRSSAQYVRAIDTLHAGLTERGLRALVWNDSACHWPRAAIHREKSLLAEELIPRDVIQVLWDYGAWDPDALGRIRDAGFDLWGAPGGDPEHVAAMRDRLIDVGGSGILLTHWIACIAKNREALFERIRACGPVCSGGTGGQRDV